MPKRTPFKRKPKRAHYVPPPKPRDEWPKTVILFDTGKRVTYATREEWAESARKRYGAFTQER